MNRKGKITSCLTKQKSIYSLLFFMDKFHSAPFLLCLPIGPKNAAHPLAIVAQ
jgi:hypothetical protein